MRYPQILEELGFSDKESAVYLAILALDSATVADIAEKAQIQRTTCYEILDSLLHRGLLTKYTKHKKIYFSGGDPRRLLSYLDHEKEESIKKIELQKSKVSEVMSEFLSLIEPKSTKPKVELYEGEKGMREAYEDTLTADGEILAYANVETMHEALPNFFPEYYTRRTAAGVKIKAIMPANADSLARAKKDKEELRESVILPDARQIFSPEVNIYNNKMLIASWKEKMAVIIESKELADLQRVIYKIVWDALKNQK